MTRSKTDGNQTEIVAALKKAGASVLHLHTLRHGAPDLCVGFRGRNYLMEIKTERGRMTPDEYAFEQNWNGSYFLVRTVDEALLLIGAMA